MTPSKHPLPALMLSLALLLGVSNAQADLALQLAQRVYDRPDGKDATALTTMTLTEKGHGPRVRKMISYRLDKKGGEKATLIRFTDPTDIEGTGLLTLDYAIKDSDQWIYLPAMERVRRISSSRMGGRFVNSNYYYEDLRDRSPTKDNHRILGRESIDGVACEMLESLPTDPDNSVYRKRVSWVDPTSLLPLRIDYYEKRDDRPSKRWTVTKREKIQGYWTVLDSVMTDLDSGFQTRLTLEKVLYDRRLPSRLFSTQVLGDESAEEDYRP